MRPSGASGPEVGDRWFGPITRPRLTGAEILFRGEYGMSLYVTGNAGDGGSAHNGHANLVSGTYSLYQVTSYWGNAEAKTRPHSTSGTWNRRSCRTN